MELNVPKLDGEVVAGMQQASGDRAVFPDAGQTATPIAATVFVGRTIGDVDPKFASKEAEELAHVRENPQSVVLITGGDPMA